MDELWQRYRTFFTPVLIGLGVFLVGLIAVYVITDDPEAKVRTLDRADKNLRSLVVPSRGQIAAQKELAEAYGKRVKDWARRLNQTSDGDGDLYDTAATQILRATLLRGASAADAESPRALARAFFDGDEDTARARLRTLDQLKADWVNALRTKDPNVSFSTIRSWVDDHFARRANQYDVEIRTEGLGFGDVPVSRATLPQRLLNLALVSRVVNQALERGVERIDQIQVDRPQPGRSDQFLREWWVKFVIVGRMEAVKAILAMLTDEQAPVALGDTVIRLPRNTSPLSGVVELDLKAYSVLVQADASLGLNEEEEDA
ncbi:MAG: hypothetical protein QNJ98_10240 [Planctomycetota bacterium]|nr:hypothetical protein [Planctomycetota bacterium]